MPKKEWLDTTYSLPRLDQPVEVKHLMLGERTGRLIVALGAKQWHVDQWGKVPLFRVSHWRPLGKKK